MGKSIIKNTGFMSLYNGISAAVLMSGTYSTARFAFYELSKKHLIQRKNKQNSGSVQINDIDFHEKLAIASMAGGIGGLIGKYLHFEPKKL